MKLERQLYKKSIRRIASATSRFWIQTRVVQRTNLYQHALPFTRHRFENGEWIANSPPSAPTTHQRLRVSTLNVLAGCFPRGEMATPPATRIKAAIEQIIVLNADVLGLNEAPRILTWLLEI